MSDFDFEIKKRFAELRADDESNAPMYAAVRDRRRDGVEVRSIAPARDRARWIAPLLLAAGGAVLAAVWAVARAPSLGQPTREAALRRDSSANAIRWTMPTDGLLLSARRTLQTPALFGSVLDAAAVPIQGTPFKGN